MRGVAPAVIGALGVSVVQMAPHAAPDVFTWCLLGGTIAIALFSKVGPLPLMAGAQGPDFCRCAKHGTSCGR
jgi:chromate transporter